MTFAACPQSSNIGTIQAAELMGPNKRVRKYLQRFGMGQSTGLILPSENRGEVPPLDKWGDPHVPEYRVWSGLLGNAIQMTSAKCSRRSRNGGVRVTPRIIDSKIDTDGTVEWMPEGRQPEW